MKNARLSLLLVLLLLLFSSMPYVIAYQYHFVSEKHQISAGLIIENEQPVGGIFIPVDKLELLAPYIGLTILLVVAVVTVGYVKKRKRHTEINS